MRSGPLERRPGLVHRYLMDGRGWIGRHGFWPLALLWLPAGIVAQAAVRFGPDAVAAGTPGPWLAAMAMEGLSLAPLVPCGLPLALGCRRLWRLGCRRGAWLAGVALGAVTVPVAVFAGLLGPLAIAVCAVALSLPVWIAWWWLAWRG
ncbi:MAG: hypothetical protein OXO52_01450 [Rhodospirillales bacterium]|nr:hypothetical protein [Rhodospirillales bacterium]